MPSISGSSSSSPSATKLVRVSSRGNFIFARVSSGTEVIFVRAPLSTRSLCLSRGVGGLDGGVENGSLGRAAEGDASMPSLLGIDDEFFSF